MSLYTNIKRAVSPVAMFLRLIRELIGTRLWFAPLMGAVGAGLLALAALYVDRHLLGEDWVPYAFLFAGSNSSATGLLAALAGSMATLLALVFTTITIIVQLSSGLFSPRALRTLYQDITMHLTIGALVSAFTYNLVILYALAPDDEGAVPQVAISLGFILGLGALLGFVVYSHHILHAVRVTSVIERISTRTQELIDSIYPIDGEDGSPWEEGGRAPIQILISEEAGVLTSLDKSALLEAAGEAKAELVVRPMVGDFVLKGDPLLYVYGAAPLEPEVVSALVFKNERTLEQDIGFGFRLLVDIAERALSPSLNDPTTAVQVMDQLHHLLRLIGLRPEPTGRCRDDDGVFRLNHPCLGWEDLLLLSCAEIRRFGASSLQVCRRMRHMLLDLQASLPEERQGALQRELDLLAETITLAFDSEEDRRLAQVADPQGLGHSLRAEVKRGREG